MNEKKPVQCKAFVNNMNELELVDKNSLVKTITFENCHLVAEYLLAHKQDVAEALFQELKYQRNNNKIGA